MNQDDEYPLWRGKDTVVVSKTDYELLAARGCVKIHNLEWAEHKRHRFTVIPSDNSGHGIYARVTDRTCEQITPPGMCVSRFTTISTVERVYPTSASGWIVFLLNSGVNAIIVLLLAILAIAFLTR